MEQQQLFTGLGKPRTSRRQRRSLEQRQKQNQRTHLRKLELKSRLVGEGPVKTDPQTGRRYDTRSGNPKLAFPHDCPRCGTEFWAGRRYLRVQGDLCPRCSRQTAMEKQRAPNGSTHAGQNGYRVIKINGEWILEHRYVMATILGRDLTDDESVHHIDGDRTNNTPGNLQLRRRYHGPGQTYACCDCGSQNIAPVELA